MEQVRMAVGLRALLPLLFVALCACASQEGVRVRIDRAIPQPGDRSVFVVAPRQKARIVRSLDDAGFSVVDDMLDSPYYLRVTLGVSQGTRACGSLHNVKYALSSGRPVLEMSGKGWTGSCEPNILDEMSLRLMSEFDKVAEIPARESNKWRV